MAYEVVVNEVSATSETLLPKGVDRYSLWE